MTADAGAGLVARVLPDVAGFDRELDYLVPPELAGSVRPGTVVRVPLQGRRVSGWVLAYPVPPEPGVALRPLSRVTGWGPEPEVVDLAGWAAWRWAGRRRSLLFSASSRAAVRDLQPRPAARPNRVGAPGHGAGPSAADADARGTAGAGPALVDGAWRPGAHVLRLAPALGASELVLAAAERGPVLVVAPTTARAEAGCAALRRRGARVALLPGDWPRARAGAEVVIGARAAAWGPCPGLAAVVVLDAHDEGLVQEQAPTWDAPSVAAERARRSGAPCLWVTPCPTLELLRPAGGAHLTSRSTERAGWAPLRVIDSRNEDPRSGLYPRALVDLLRQEPATVVCVLNRKGRALLLDCAACREPATCERCGSGVGLVGDRLTCRRCATSRPVVCRACGSDSLRLFRVGVSRAREQLEALTGRPTGEVTAGSGPLPPAPVIVGTEAVLHREAELRRAGGTSAVVFLDFDQELLAPRYRAGEEALALLARASRLVGGRLRQGKVVVQTRLPGHPVIEAAALADPGRLAAAEEPVREELRLPPFAALAVLSGPGAREVAGRLKQAAPVVEVSETAEGPQSRWVIKASDHGALSDALARAGRPAERVRVEVGPVRI